MPPFLSKITTCGRFGVPEYSFPRYMLQRQWRFNTDYTGSLQSSRALFSGLDMRSLSGPVARYIPASTCVPYPVLSRGIFRPRYAFPTRHAPCVLRFETLFGTRMKYIIFQRH